MKKVIRYDSSGIKIPKQANWKTKNHAKCHCGGCGHRGNWLSNISRMLNRQPPIKGV